MLACDILFQADQESSLAALGQGLWMAVTYPIDPELTVATETPQHLMIHPGSERMAARLIWRQGVLVVGSAQSGAQIAEEIAAADREVFLATSAVGRLLHR